MRAKVKEADKVIVSCCDERPRVEGTQKLAHGCLEEHDHADDDARRRQDPEQVRLRDSPGSSRARRIR